MIQKINRKGFYSFILQGFVDSCLYFQSINLSWPGHVHDTQVLTNTDLYQKAEVGSLVPHVRKQTSGIQIPPIVACISSETMTNDTIQEHWQFDEETSFL